MKTGIEEKTKPALPSGREFRKNEKFKELFSALKKNVLNKSKKISGLFSPAPAKIAKLTAYPVAIDLGANTLKFLQLDKASAGIAVRKIGFSRSALSASLINEYQIEGKIAACIPLNEVQVFSFLLPNMPENEIEHAVTWKLKQNLPAGTDINSVSFDYNWSVLSKEGPNKEILVLAFAAPKEKIMQRIDLLRKFSLQVCAIEPEPYAVFKALFFFKKIPAQDTVIILNLGESESSIIIAHCGAACLIRPLPLSVKSMIEAVANFHKFDSEKSSGILKKEGFDLQNAAGSVCMPALSSQIEGLVVDLEHTFKFFSHQLMKSQVAAYSRVILCGAAAGLKNLDKCLSEKLGVPVDVFNPLEYLTFAPGQALSAEVKENAHSFAAEDGMAAGYLEQ